MRYGDGRQNSSSGDREAGKPHPDCDFNYWLWRGLINKNKEFVKNLITNNIGIKEYFKFNGKEHIHEVLKPKRQHGHDIYPYYFESKNFLDMFKGAIPVYVQLRIDRQNISTLNFQQSGRDFKSQCSFILKVDLERDDI